MRDVTENEALKVFKTVAALYPMFNSKGSDEAKREIAKIWLWKLKKGNYKRTMHLLDKYSNENKYPPSVADILGFEHKVIKNVDYSVDIQKVNEEMSDPKKAIIRKEKLKKLEIMLGGVDGE